MSEFGGILSNVVLEVIFTLNTKRSYILQLRSLDVTQRKQLLPSSSIILELPAHADK